MDETTILMKDLEQQTARRFREIEEMHSRKNAIGGAYLGKSVDQCAASESIGQPMPPPSERITIDNIDDLMHFQPWTRDQIEAGNVVRETLTAAAKAILRSVPESPFRTVALRAILDARMNANAAISFRGRF